MLFKGISEVEISGIKRGFKFGTLSSGFLCQEEKITMREMADRLANPTPLTAINCLYAAAKSYNLSKKKPVDFTPEDVADWIDELGIDKAFEMIYNSMQVYDGQVSEKKNQTETDQTGQSTTGSPSESPK